MADTDEQLDRKAVAALIGVDPDSVTRGVRMGTYPEPDGHLGGRPWWWKSTLTGFEPPRPGRPRRADGAAQVAHGPAQDAADTDLTRGDAQ